MASNVALDICHAGLTPMDFLAGFVEIVKDMADRLFAFF
jgi:hypothetical protein